MADKIIKLEQFEGPLSLLLQLIKKEELDISEISLVKVTDQYIAILKQQEYLHPDELADFLVVAAQLLYLKSKLLLPYYQAEEEEQSELEQKLRLYRHFVQAAKLVRSKWDDNHQSTSRQRLVIKSEVKFSPPSGVELSDLQRIMVAVLSELEPLVKLKTKKLDNSVTIGEKIELIKKLVQHRRQLSFSVLLQQASNKTEKIISFLAVLELVKQQQVKVRQNNLFNEITIELNN